jgi:hypothetical protein
MTLRRFDLVHDKQKKAWQLKDATGAVKRSFDSKGDVTAGGVLEDVLGPQGGTVRIHDQDGKIQEERTFPGSKDPRRSPG